MGSRGLLWFIGLFAVAAATAQAQEAAAPRQRTPGEVQAARMARTGGLVAHRGPGAAIAVIDARPGAGAGEWDALKADMESFCMVAFEFRARPLGRGETPLKAARAALSGKGAAGVAVVLSDEGADAPGMTVYPEDRMALVNASRAAPKGTAPDVASRRLATQLWRAVCFAAGGVNTRSPHCALSSTVLSAEDIDGLSARMPNPDACAQVLASAERLGLARVRTATYRAACMQGWAPAPTNDIQRAVWDEVKGKGEKGITE